MNVVKLVTLMKICHKHLITTHHISKTNNTTQQKQHYLTFPNTTKHQPTNKTTQTRGVRDSTLAVDVYDGANPKKQHLTQTHQHQTTKQTTHNYLKPTTHTTKPTQPNLFPHNTKYTPQHTTQKTNNTHTTHKQPIRNNNNNPPTTLKLFEN